MDDPAIARFHELRRGLYDVLSFRSYRDRRHEKWNVEIVMGDSDGSRGMKLTFGGVTQLSMEAHSGTWLIEVDNVVDRGWEGISYWITEGEANAGEDVKFYAESFEVEEVGA